MYDAQKQVKREHMQPFAGGQENVGASGAVGRNTYCPASIVRGWLSTPVLPRQHVQKLGAAPLSWPACSKAGGPHIFFVTKLGGRTFVSASMFKKAGGPHLFPGQHVQQGLEALAAREVVPLMLSLALVVACMSSIQCCNCSAFARLRGKITLHAQHLAGLAGIDEGCMRLGVCTAHGVLKGAANTRNNTRTCPRSHTHTNAHTHTSRRTRGLWTCAQMCPRTP